LSINFLGLNSGFDSAALVQQLIQVETQSRIQPLQTKKRTLETERTFIGAVGTDIGNLRTKLNIDNLHDGTDTLFPRLVTSTDTDKEFFTVTADGSAVPQQFNIEIDQLATSTVRRSTASISAGITGATVLDDIATKGTVAIASGTVTINGVTQTLTVNTATDDVNDILSFFQSFGGVGATLNANGHIDLTGITSLGGAGDTSNLISALGFNNATISGANVSSLQNLDAMKASSNLNTIGVNGTNININGEDITFDPANDSINDLITRINSNVDTKVTASYDALNGKIVLTNDDTGALSLTVSSSDSNILTLFNITGGETLGDNAEFSVSTINGGATLVSNSNTVEGIVDGLTIQLSDVTTSAKTVTITQDKDSYRKNIEAVLKDTATLVKKLEAQKGSFARSFAQTIKNTISTYFSAATNTYKSGVELGITTTLDGDNKFSSYSIDEDTFEDALAADEASVHAVLYGKTGTVVDPMSDASSGILVQLRELLDAYSDPDVEANGILFAKEESLDTQISNVEDDIESRQASITAYEKRLKAQFTALDTVSAQLQSQQAALSAFTGAG